MELCYDAEDVVVDTEGEKEVPELEYFGEGGCAGAEGHYGGEGVDFGGEVFGSQVGVERGIEDFQA